MYINIYPINWNILIANPDFAFANSIITSLIILFFNMIH